jgi:hypothetical protein
MTETEYPEHPIQDYWEWFGNGIYGMPENEKPAQSMINRGNI